VQIRTGVQLSRASRACYPSAMVAAAVSALSSLLAATTSQLGREITIECKHFFSGAAAYANGRIFMTMTSVGVALKLPQESRAELTRHGATPLRYFPRGPVKKDYIILPDRIVRDADALAPWVIKSTQFSRRFSKPRRVSRTRAGPSE